MTALITGIGGVVPLFRWNANSLANGIHIEAKVHTAILWIRRACSKGRHVLGRRCWPRRPRHGRPNRRCFRSWLRHVQGRRNGAPTALVSGVLEVGHAVFWNAKLIALLLPLECVNPHAIVRCLLRACVQGRRIGRGRWRWVVSRRGARRRRGAPTALIIGVLTTVRLVFRNT